jgi:hypothetical protein
LGDLRPRRVEIGRIRSAIPRYSRGNVKHLESGCFSSAGFGDRIWNEPMTGEIWFRFYISSL